MSLVVRSGVVLAISMAGAAVTGRAAAYCRTTNCSKCPLENGCPTGSPIAWPTSCVTFSMQYSASKVVDLDTATVIMEKAFAAWTDASCPDGGSPPSIQVDHHFNDVACNLHEYNRTDGNANIIVFRDDVWPYEGASNVLALTTVTYQNTVILDVDMEINATQRLSVGDPVPATSYDLQSIVTHEAGHFLGMAHSTDPTATMAPQYMSGAKSFRLLALDDVEGICAVYPPDQVLQCDSTPRHGFSPECGIFPSGDGGKCALAGRGPGDKTPARHAWLGYVAVLGVMGLVGRRVRRASRWIEPCASRQSPSTDRVA